MPQGIEGSNPSPSAFASLKLGSGEMKSAKTSESGVKQIAEARLRRDEIRQDERKRGKTKNMYHVYSLRCKDGYYVGCTDNIEDRVRRHQKGQVPATANRLPVKLEFHFAIEDKYKAFEFEKYLKSGSGRAFVNKHLA